MAAARTGCYHRPRRRLGAQDSRMTAVAFDTLKLARTLRDKAKLSPE
ncbi:hypothetical protein [Methylobacterium oryzisoli]